MAFIIDTSALIGAWRRTYPPDVLPRFWTDLDELGQRSQLVVPEEVLVELKAKDDDLHAWVAARANHLVAPSSRQIMLAAKAVLTDHPRLTMIGTGRGTADPFVIATAQVTGGAVVTEERGGSQDKPRIPFVCSRLTVKCMGVLDLIREQRWSYGGN